MRKIFLLILLFTYLYSSPKEIKTIAFAQDDMSNDFRKAQVYQGIDEAKKYPHIRYIYSDARGHTSLLLANIQRYIDMNVDAIIIGTNDEKALNPLLKRAYADGKNIIILDRGVDTLDYTTFINSDNIKIGQIGAEYIANRLNGKGVVLLLEGLPKADVTKLRTKGFCDAIAKHKDIKVIKRVGNYLRRDTIIEMEKLLADGIKFDAIFAESDSMLSGVRSVFKRWDIDPKSIITVGCDYTTEAQNAIKNGTQSASILFPLGTKESIQIAIDIFDNKAIPKHISIPVELVTKENVDKIKPIF